MGAFGACCQVAGGAGEGCGWWGVGVAGFGFELLPQSFCFEAVYFLRNRIVRGGLAGDGRRLEFVLLFSLFVPV